jgi:membrane fusion protein, heavy metal efflux system
MPLRLKKAKWAGLVLVASAGVAVTSLIWPPLADQSENAQPAKSGDPPGTFRPTQTQWKGLKLEPVTVRAFRPEQVTEGAIAVDAAARVAR